jgi:predicted RecB family nuclease
LKQRTGFRGASGGGMDLEDVKGVGESAASKLRAAGIETVEELSELDLRQRTVDGLSSENLASLRDNARRLLDAQEAPDLVLVEGLGPSTKDKLHAAGVKTIHDLAELDLRSVDVDGLSTDHVQKLKRNARYLVV